MLSVMETLQTLREKTGLSQSRAAEMLCVSKNHLSAIERGMHAPRLALVLRMADIYHGTLADIIRAASATRALT